MGKKEKGNVESGTGNRKSGIEIKSSGLFLVLRFAKTHWKLRSHLK
ncbi:hypothetical protein CKA32_001595 [Geitlerinema sp. FC II]|nr:hypothetical protein CKA32_001595 [Geitlerinema sp. FC II]